MSEELSGVADPMRVISALPAGVLYKDPSISILQMWKLMCRGFAKVPQTVIGRVRFKRSGL